MATAYRRKRLMEGIINGDKEVQAQIQQISDKANLEALQSTKAAEVELLRAKAASDAAATATAADRATGGLGGGGVARAPSGRPLRRIGQVDVNRALLDALHPDERRIVSSLSNKTAPNGARAPPPPLNLLGTARPYGHFSHSPTHKQLMESPQLLDLRFVHQSTIRLPAGATGPLRAQSGLPAGLTPSTAQSGGGSGGYGGISRESATGGGAAAAARRSSANQRLAAAGAAVGASAGQLGRRGSDDVLPQLRYEGGGVAYPSSRQPAGRTLGTYSGSQDRVARG
ncbi:hypothetical protein TSOC_013700 [Tetrabaena socialis]|uniref:Uncharacterized protein n=1 Tax=Tetrabaena socialis TaxID=47790 RepID=A0A2J7ZJM7_9CHLO|nr:hypothetical protein TSOC_013700 [Tetrabaena socialis]|eukprot:PNH00475.1 hypothetical protein TSOC_013700 [Tetrabaena socialis]